MMKITKETIRLPNKIFSPWKASYPMITEYSFFINETHFRDVSKIK